MTWLNHNSTIILGLGIMALAGFFLLRDGFKRTDLFYLGILAALLVLLWLGLRPRQVLPGQGAELKSQIGAGLPVLLEIQSPF